MSIFNYLEKVFNGLPTYDSGKLIAAKKHRPTLNAHESISNYDLHSRDMDPFMFGAIAPKSDANDLLNSKQIAEMASEIYKLCDK